MPAISIIVPVYKVEEYLPKCIDSILAQTFADFELILVDDGSPDNCGKICDEYADKDNRIVVIHKENGGVSSARNAGLDIAKGKYIGFIDSDDYIDPDMYETLYNNLVNNNADISICGIFVCYKNVIKNYYSNPISGVFSGIDAFKLALSGKGCAFAPYNKLYKKEILDTIRFPALKIGEDLFIIGDIMLKAKKVIICTDLPKYYYVQRQDSAMQERGSPSIFHAIEACQYNIELIRSSCPQVLPYGLYRLWRTYKDILDRLSAASTEDRVKYKSNIEEIKKSMRSHLREILTSPVSGYKTKCANLLIIISPYLYMKIMKRIITGRNNLY